MITERLSIPANITKYQLAANGTLPSTSHKARENTTRECLRLQLFSQARFRFDDKFETTSNNSDYKTNSWAGDDTNYSNSNNDDDDD